MSSILSNENDSLLQSFDIIRISPSPEDDERYREENSNSIGHSGAISIDAQSINITDSMLSNHTPHNSLPIESGAASIVSTISQESVIINNSNSLRSVEPNSLSKNSIRSEVQRSSLTNSRTVNSLNDIGPEIIMGHMQISNIGDYSYICGPKSDDSKVRELQARFKNTEEILKRNNIKLRQQYAKLQTFQNEVQEAAELSSKRLEERDQEIRSLKATVNELEIKSENLKEQNDWSQENFRLNLNFLETENFEFKKTISEKLAIISNMSAEMKKLQDQNIYLANNSKNSMSKTMTAAPNPHNEAKLKDLERNNSALLAENLDLRDMITKFKSEIHAREVHLCEAQERSRYKITEIERLNVELGNEIRQKVDLQNRIGVLEIYLTDCKADFERERQERASLAGNREELLSQLKMSQTRNQKLVDEVHKINGAASSNKSKASPPRTMPSKGEEDFQFSSKPTFMCPICSRHYTNYVALQHHVDQCLQ